MKMEVEATTSVEAIERTTGLLGTIWRLRGLKGGWNEFTWRRPSGIIQLKGAVYYILNIILI
jgi:hypothetical protein